VTCALCDALPVPLNYASPRKCAFDSSGAFTRDNWNCETMNELRRTCELEDRNTDENSVYVIRQLGGEDSENEENGHIVLTAYKRRGSVGGARIVVNDKPDLPLTLSVAEATLRERTHG